MLNYQRVNVHRHQRLPKWHIPPHLTQVAHLGDGGEPAGSARGRCGKRRVKRVAFSQGTFVWWRSFHQQEFAQEDYIMG
jgi:hypothetical protein